MTDSGRIGLAATTQAHRLWRNDAEDTDGPLGGSGWWHGRGSLVERWRLPVPRAHYRLLGGIGNKKRFRRESQKNLFLNFRIRQLGLLLLVASVFNGAAQGAFLSGIESIAQSLLQRHRARVEGKHPAPGENLREIPVAAHSQEGGEQQR